MLVKDPVYLQLAQELRDLIRRDGLEVGSRFLTEREVGERFAVSRATANKALSSLVAEGVLEFKKGVGTFVRTAMLEYDLRALVSFTDKAMAAGKSPSTRVLEFARVAAGKAEPAVREALDVQANDDLYRMVRLRLADEAPVILEQRYVVARFCPRLKTADLAGSLYALWTGRYGLSIAGADETIRAVNLHRKEAGLLGVPARGAGLEIVSIGYLRDGAPLWWERTLYRGDAYELHNRLGPIQAAGPAAGVLRDFHSNDIMQKGNHHERS